MSSFPTGTVTFLFTDIEGSTKLWEEQTDAMRAALARHNELMQTAIDMNNGHVFKIVGDAYCAAFANPANALSAALTAQERFQAPLRTGDLSLSVRMAIHSGAAERVANDYVGPTLNRVSRLLSAAHPQQVLVSAATQGLLGHDLTQGMSLLDLGEHPLRDLRSGRIYQLAHASIRSEFPPILSLSSDKLPNNLPLQLTTFVGREQSLIDLKDLLGNSRLLTITGSGGAGKSRLMIQFAADMLGDFLDGVWLAELAPLSDPSLVSSTIAGALKLREEPGRPILATITDYLKDRSALLLLDNCEHLLDEASRVAETLVQACPKLRIITTSREALQVTGEQSYRIPSLGLPPAGDTVNLQSLEEIESVRLFVDRATLAQPSFALTESNASSVAQICRRLDGIPLALELAAARVRALSPDQIASRLDDRFRLLTGGSRTALPRQQTLRALIDWSYDLLSEKEKTLLRRLSVFAGGWTLEAAEKVCSDDAVIELKAPA
jgi:class 3 adenylate cyclase